MRRLRIQSWIRHLKKNLLSPEEIYKKLENTYYIKHRRHKIYPNLVLFKYNQIESPFAELLVQECRGIILDEANNWSVVSFPYKKFFNYGESLAADINWNTARVFEKMDGSLCTVYTYAGKVHVATSGTPDANTGINFDETTFQELFWRTFNALGYSSALFEPNYCYMFELCTPLNRVVVQHQENRIYLHGARNLDTLEEECPVKWSNLLGIPCVPLYNLKDMEDVLQAAGKLDPLHNEGYVVCDASFNRIKVKSPAYVMLHHMKSGASAKMLADVIRKNETPEFLAYFPEFTQEYNKLKYKYDELVDSINRLWSEAKPLVGFRKGFAAFACTTDHPAALFQLYDGRVKDVVDYLANMKDNSYYELMGVKKCSTQP